MGIINKVAVLLQSSLGSKLDEIGRATGVIRRQRKFSGASLLKTMVLTVMKTPRPHTNDFVATAALLGVNVTAEAIEKRFSEKLVAHLRAGLEHVLESVVEASAAGVALLDKFTAVVIADSTTVTLPDEFEAEFPGCGGKTGSGKAAVKIQVAWELRRGQLEELEVHPGRHSDATSVDVDAPVASGSLTLRDLGYFCLERFRSIGRKELIGFRVGNTARPFSTRRGGDGRCWRFSDGNPPACRSTCRSRWARRSVWDVG